MKRKLLKFEIKGLKGYQNSKLSIDLTNQSRGSGTEDLDNLFGSIYLNKVIAFPGINSSGKTTVINLINWIIDFYQGKTSTNSLAEMARLENFIEVVVFFYFNNQGYKSIEKIYSKIVYNKEKKKYIIEDEVLFFKEINTTTTRSNLFEFGEADKISREYYIELIQKVRNETVKSKSESNGFFFFAEDKSFIHFLSRFNEIDIILNKAELNDKSFADVQNINMNVINYLDGSIKELEKLDNDLYVIKFNDDVSNTLSVKSVLKMLSNGTKKAYNMYDSAMKILKTGGYLLIDEIEMSLNTELVKDLIMMFYNEELNKRDATLILTTHYTEILDFIPRNDAINICYKNDKGLMEIKNFALIGNRNDVNRHSIFKSGTFISNTRPEYSKYNKVINDIRRYVNDDEN